MRNQPRVSRGFTLVELLVVLGIIVILLGLLIPTVSRVRQTAYATAAQQNIASLSTAIDQYQLEFRSAPGLVNNASIGAANVPGAGVITGTENMTLSMLGGINPTGPAFDLSRVGTGMPNLYEPGKKYPAFIDAAKDRVGQIAGFADTVVPEFLDAYPDPLPILYIRANRGATDVVCSVVGATTGQYNVSQLQNYLFAPNITDFPASGALDAGVPGAYNYFRNPNVPDTARQKDAYILIAAGRDRVYGTKDDLTNFGKF